MDDRIVSRRDAESSNQKTPSENAERDDCDVRASPEIPSFTSEDVARLSTDEDEEHNLQCEHDVHSDTSAPPNFLTRSHDLKESSTELDEYSERLAQLKKEMGVPITIEKLHGLTYHDLHLTQESIEELKNYIAKHEDEIEGEANTYNYSSSSDESDIVYAGAYHFKSENPYAKTPEEMEREKEKEEHETEHYLLEKRENYLKQRQKELIKQRPDEVQLSERDYYKLIQNTQLQIEMLTRKSTMRIEEIRLEHVRRLDKEKGFYKFLNTRKLKEKEEKIHQVPIGTPGSTFAKLLRVRFAKTMSTRRSIAEQVEGAAGKEVSKYICKEHLQELEERACLQKLLFPLESRKQELEEQLLKLKRMKWLEFDRLKREKEKKALRTKDKVTKGSIKSEKLQRKYLESYSSEDSLSDMEDENFFMSAQPAFENHQYSANVRKKAFNFDYVDLKNLNHDALIALEIKRKKNKAVGRKKKTKAEEKETTETETVAEDFVVDKVTGIHSDSYYLGGGQGKPIHELNMPLFKEIFKF